MNNDDIAIPAPFNTDEAFAYIARVLEAPFGTIASELIDALVCGDCDQFCDYPEARNTHTMISDFVIIGCEGVWQIESLR